MSDKESAAPATEHLNIKVTDNNNEVFFKIKRTTQLKKLMDAFCERQGKQISTVRFLFDGTRVRPEDSPETVCSLLSGLPSGCEIPVLTTATARHGRRRHSRGPPGADRRLLIVSLCALESLRMRLIM
jgi:small ubiquitin-related modifier